MRCRSIIGLLALFMLALCSQTLAGDLRFALVVKSQGNGFFDACEKGALQAAKELGGIEIIYAGPTAPTTEGQVEIIRSLIDRRVDGIIVSANAPDALVTICLQAMDNRIPVMSFDSEIAKKGRIVHLAPSSPLFIGRQQVELMGQAMDYSGEFAIVSTAPEAANQKEWIASIRQTLENDPKYREMKLVEIVYGDDQADTSHRKALALIHRRPQLKGILAPTTVGLPASAQAVVDAGKTGKIFVTGLGLPSEMSTYVKQGVVRSFSLWNPLDLGYSTVFIMKAIIDKTITGKRNEEVTAGRVGVIPVGEDSLMVMAAPFVFTDENIDDWSRVF